MSKILPKAVSSARVSPFESPREAEKLEADTHLVDAPRLQSLWTYAQHHAPGKVVWPGIPEAPSLSGKRMLVVNKGPNPGMPGASSVMVMDLSDGKLLATLPTEAGPHEVAIAPKGRLALAPNYGLQKQGADVAAGGGHSLSLIDLETNQLKTIELPGYFRPHGVDWLDETHAVVTVDGKHEDLSSGYLLLIDVQSGRVEREYRTGEPGTHLVRHSPDARYLYTSNIQGGSFSRIDRSTGEVKTLKTGKGTEGFDFTPDGKEIWTGNLEESTISVIDVERFALKETFPSPGAYPIRFKFVSPDLLLVANRGSNDLSFIHPRTRQPLGPPVKFELTRFTATGPDASQSSVPMQIELSDDKRLAFVGNSHAGLVSVVDLPARQIVGYYLAGDKPDPLAIYDTPHVGTAPKPTQPPFGERVQMKFWQVVEKTNELAAEWVSHLRKPVPLVYARHGVVAFDAATHAVLGDAGGAFVTNAPLTGLVPRGMATIHALPLPGREVKYQVHGQPPRSSGKTDEMGFQPLTREEFAHDGLNGINPRMGGLVKVEIEAEGKTAEQRILALPADYDGPIFVSDLNLTLRDVTTAGVALGKSYRPVPGSDTVLRQVAERGVPIIYLSGGFEAEQPWNEEFMKQFPSGPLLIRPKASMAEIGSNALADVNMGGYKLKTLSELQRLFPKAQWIGLGDDKHEDPEVYTKLGFGKKTFIRNTDTPELDVPSNFMGAAAVDGNLDEAFRAKILAAVDDAIGHSTSFRSQAK